MHRFIDGGYIKYYKDIFKTYLRDSPKGYYDESALPAYTSHNPVVSYVFWKRIDTVLSLFTNINGSYILDMGCGGCVLQKYFSYEKCNVDGCENQFYDLSSDMVAKIDSSGVIYKDLFDIKNKKYNYIVALDVLEHIEDLKPIVYKLMELSKNNTKIILSGPTENIIYRLGRFIIGYSGHYHKRTIYDVEKELKQAGMKMTHMNNIFPIFKLFRISVWSVL
jgi:2-polyprenyl-3-methyl-5-hydroxy-6-metoxy-1,4-benzoquinol methylase